MGPVAASHPEPERWRWNWKRPPQTPAAVPAVLLIEGEISVGNEVLSMRDGIGIWEIDEFSITAHSDSKILLIEIPMV